VELLDRPGRVAQRGRLGEVVGQLGQVRLGVVPGRRLQGQADAVVEPAPARGREVLVQRLAHELVGERVAPGGGRVLAHDPGPLGLGQGLDEGPGAQAADPAQEPQVEVAADHRGHLEVGHRLGGQAGQPATEQAAELLGDARPGSGRHAPGPGQLAVGEQGPDQLADEQRVALGDLVDPGHHRRGGRLAGQPPHVGGHLGPAEAAEREAAPHPGQVAEQVGQLVEARVGVPVGADDHQPLVGGGLGEEPEQEQRRRVGRVQVVQDHQHRPGVGDPAQEPAHRVEQHEADRLGLGGRRCGREARLQLTAGRPDDLHPRPVGRGPAVLPAAADQHPPALALQQPGQLLHEPRLADPGRARDEEQQVPVGGSLPQAGQQLPQLPDPADEGPRRRARRGGGHRPALLAAGVGRVGHRAQVSGGHRPCPTIWRSPAPSVYGS
jgi:hypothetical protein